MLVKHEKLLVTTVFILLCFIAASVAQASDTYTYWRANGHFVTTPEEACSFINTTYSFDHFVMNGSNSGNCVFIDSSNGLTQETPISRTTVSCPDGQHVDKSLTPPNCNWGDPPPPENKCAALKGTELSAFRWESSTDDPPQTISPGGCGATVSQARCSYVSAGRAVCTGKATYTGDEQSVNPKGSADSCTGDACTAGSPAPETKSQDCVYSSDGSGSSSCSATNSQSNPGTSQCGTVNGSYKCIENPKATATTSTLNSTKTPTTNANGTLTIVQDDTVTTVKCTGRSCNTTKTNSSGTTVTNSSGQVISHTSTCTGSQCTPSGSASPSAGTGSSTGSGTGKGEEEEGDEDSGSGGTLNDPSNGTFDGQASDWDGKIEKSKKDLKDGIDKIKDSFKPLGDVSLGAGGGQLYCPPSTTIPYLNITLNFCLNEYASSLQWLSSAIFAGCALLALFIVFA